jgi:hypothetical protein
MRRTPEFAFVIGSLVWFVWSKDLPSILAGACFLWGSMMMALRE